MTHGWLTPDLLTPTVAHCRRLLIPGDHRVLDAVLGALTDLLYAHSWQQYGEQTPLDTAQALNHMWAELQIEVWSMIGAIVPTITAETPPGCLPCDGSVYDAVDYPDLYAVIDDTLKLPGSQFATPDLRGRTVIGVSTTHLAFTTGGEETHILSVAELPAHTHADSGHQHTTGNSAAGVAVTPGELPVLVPNPVPALTGIASANNASAGSGDAHNNMQPYTALRYVVIAQ